MDETVLEEVLGGGVMDRPYSRAGSPQFDEAIPLDRDL